MLDMCMQQAIAKWVKATLLGRCGDSAPAKLPEGDVYMMIDGGKDRKRAFLKNFPLKSGAGKDPNHAICHTFTMHINEASWRQRRLHAHGRAKLTQNIYVVAASKTMKAVLKRKNSFMHHGGSIRTHLSILLKPAQPNGPNRPNLFTPLSGRIQSPCAVLQFGG